MSFLTSVKSRILSMSFKSFKLWFIRSLDISINSIFGSYPLFSSNRKPIKQSFNFGPSTPSVCSEYGREPYIPIQSIPPSK